MKKLLSILLCLLLVCGTFCAAHAEETKIVFCVNIQPGNPSPTVTWLRIRM